MQSRALTDSLFGERKNVKHRISNLVVLGRNYYEGKREV